jgi:hypothetical protein
MRYYPREKKYGRPMRKRDKPSVQRNLPTNDVDFPFAGILNMWRYFSSMGFSFRQCMYASEAFFDEMVTIQPQTNILLQCRDRPTCFYIFGRTLHKNELVQKVL